jgi:NitT/TauT family transport system ATP-binding protein
VTTEPIISFSHVGKRFDRQLAIEDLDLRIAPGEIVAVVGVTGCGKSTAFNLMLGLLAPTSGEVRVAGRDPYADFDWFRGRMAVVFQDARLLPWRTVLQNVRTGMRFAGVPKDQWDARAQDWLERLGLGTRGDAYVHQLSGGQRQRVAMARAFAVDPDIILCDESFSALDEVTARQLRADFTALVREKGKTAVVITHSIPEALDVGERVLVFQAPGRVAADLRPERDMDAARREALHAEIVGAMGPGALASRPEAGEAEPAGPAGPRAEAVTAE